jgi:hypothetical protein
MAAFLKGVDGNHLLTTGLEGFYSSTVNSESVEQESSNPGSFATQYGVDFIRNHDVSGIDFASVHSYPDNWYPHYPNFFFLSPNQAKKGVIDGKNWVQDAFDGGEREGRVYEQMGANPHRRRCRHVEETGAVCGVRQVPQRCGLHGERASVRHERHVRRHLRLGRCRGRRRWRPRLAAHHQHDHRTRRWVRNRALLRP